MEWIVILLLIILIILIANQKNRVADQLGNLEEEIHKLRDQLAQFSSAEKTSDKQSTSAIAPKPEIKKEDKWESGFKVMDEPYVPKEIKTPIETEPYIKPAPKQNSDPKVEKTDAKKPTVIPEIIVTHSPKKPAAPGFFESHPDLEKFIGENIISKIGIAILVLAIGFFVKFAIDNNWIGPVGRVGIGLLCGGILTALAHVLRKNYKAFSSVLVGGGLAIFYFTIALAFHQYQLFSQTMAFTIMVVITAFAVLLSILYDRQELAVISLIGGFSTPFMVSNGSNNYQALFIYLIILNIGLLAIAYNKSWRLLNLLAFIFTVVIFGSWLFMLADNVPVSTYSHGFIFATIFYILFFIINIANNIKENKKFIASDFGILLANTCLYFTAGLYLLTEMQQAEYRGLFSASMGVCNLGISYILFKNKKVDTNILYLLIGITLTFISLTAPIQLHGHFITLFWASECVLLYWLFQKSKIKIIALSSLIVWVAMLISLIMDWVNIYGYSSSSIAIIINKGFITTIYATLSCYALMIFKNKEEIDLRKTVSFYPSKNIFSIVGGVLLFTSGVLEINHQFTNHYPGTDLNILYLLLYTFLFGLIFTIIASALKLFKNFFYAAVILSACIVLYLISISTIFNIQELMLEKNQLTTHFTAHWIAAIIIAVIIYRLIALFRFDKIPSAKNNSLITVTIAIVIVFFISAEAWLVINKMFYSKLNSLENIQRVYIKTGLPILWGFCSFTCMWLGMHYKFKTLRIFGLVLFLITLLKLFLFDIQNIPVAGKIAAFFCLGVLLLVVSFMYQRLKKIIIDEEKPLL